MPWEHGGKPTHMSICSRTHRLWKSLNLDTVEWALTLELLQTQDYKAESSRELGTKYFSTKTTDAAALAVGPWYRKQDKNASLPQDIFLATAVVPNRIRAHFSRVSLRFLFKSSRTVSLFSAEQRPPRGPEAAAISSSSWTI